MTSDYGPYSEANYRCTEGGCEWLGCLTDEQCTELNESGVEYVCR